MNYSLVPDQVFKINNTYSAGLVSRKFQAFVKTLIDYICFASVEHRDYQLVGIEIKTHVDLGPTQGQDEVRQRSSPVKRFYTAIEETSTKFKSNVSSVHKRVQLIRHATVFNFC
jgi:hypothetical protein